MPYIQEESAIGMFGPEEENTDVLRNVANSLRVDTVQRYRRLESLARALREL